MFGATAKSIVLHASAKRSRYVGAWPAVLLSWSVMFPLCAAGAGRGQVPGGAARCRATFS